MANRLTRALALLSSLKVGGGTTIKKITSGTISINPGSIATVSRAATTFTLTGAAAGDKVLMEPPAGLDDDLLFVGARVTADDTVTVYLYNPTGGSIDDGALTWGYLWFDLT